MRRILVYGVCGSGKTMLARQIGQASGIPVIEADRLIWEPGLIPVPAGVQRERLGALAAQEAWVLESAPSAVLDAVLGRADRIIALDDPQ
jgi:adenylate kinase family enzyme